MKLAPWITFVLGAWLLLAPWAIPYEGPRGAFGEDLILGALVIIFSLGLAVGPRPHPVAAWLLALFGLWIAIAPFVLGYYNRMAASDHVLNDIVTGGAILLVALIRIFVTSRGVPVRKV